MKIVSNKALEVGAYVQNGQSFSSLQWVSNCAFKKLYPVWNVSTLFFLPVSIMVSFLRYSFVLHMHPTHVLDFLLSSVSL